MHFAKAQSPKRPTQPSVIAASLYIAGFCVTAAALQLFALESFPDVIRSYGLPVADELALPFAAIIVCLEIIAVPYLLWMKLSLLMRWVSMISGWLAIFFWLGVGIWQGVADFHIPNAGLFGAKILMPQGRWLVSYCAVLLILMVYVVWSTRRQLTHRSKPLAKPSH